MYKTVAVQSLRVAVVVTLAVLWRYNRPWVKKRFESFHLLPEYFTAARLQFLDILWGVGLGAAVPYVIYGLYSLFQTPPAWVNWLAIFGALFLAGYYVWRADHVRLQPKIKITRAISQGPSIDENTRRNTIAYYFEVLNISEALTIYDARAQLQNMVPEVTNLNFLPVLLHQKHDNPSSGVYQTTFDLNPGDLAPENGTT